MPTGSNGLRATDFARNIWRARPDGGSSELATKPRRHLAVRGLHSKAAAMKLILHVVPALILATLARPCVAQEIARTRISPSAASSASERAASLECRVYAECALRVEPTAWHGPRIVRGIEGAPAARLDRLSRPEILQLFARDDSASSYGHRFVRAERMNRALTIIGVGFAAGGLTAPHRINGFSVGGLALLAVSIPYDDAAQRYLSRAVWWYNLRLATPTGR